MLKAGEVIAAAQFEELKIFRWVLLHTATGSAPPHPWIQFKFTPFLKCFNMEKMNKFHYQKRVSRKLSHSHYLKIMKNVVKICSSSKVAAVKLEQPLPEDCAFFHRELFWYYQWSPTCSKPRHKWFDWLGKWSGIAWLWATGNCIAVPAQPPTSTQPHKAEALTFCIKFSTLFCSPHHLNLMVTNL